MDYSAGMMSIRLLPVVLVTVAAAFWFGDVQDGGPYVARNWLPLVVVVLLAALTLHRGSGRWAGSGWKLPLGTVGFAIPALGLSLYLHYASIQALQDQARSARHHVETGQPDWRQYRPQS